MPAHPPLHDANLVTSIMALYLLQLLPLFAFPWTARSYSLRSLTWLKSLVNMNHAGSNISTKSFQYMDTTEHVLWGTTFFQRLSLRSHSLLSSKFRRRGHTC